MPKSSTAMSTPMARRRSSCRRASECSVRMAVSVSSSTRPFAGMRWRRRARSTTAARSPSSTWWIDTFTERRNGRSASRAPLRHWANCRQASSITHAPKGWISPEDSLWGMNWSGMTRPRSGCSQRTRASAAITSRSAKGHHGLVLQHQLPPIGSPGQLAAEAEALQLQVRRPTGAADHMGEEEAHDDEEHRPGSPVAERLGLPGADVSRGQGTGQDARRQAGGQDAPGTEAPAGQEDGDVEPVGRDVVRAAGGPRQQERAPEQHRDPERAQGAAGPRPTLQEAEEPVVALSGPSG